MSSVLIIWTIKDERTVESVKGFWDEMSAYMANIACGFREFRTPKLFLYVPIILTVQGLFYTAGWGILRLILLDRFHFDPIAGSFVIASCALITVGILAIMHQYAENLSEKWVLSLIGVSALAGLLLSLADIGMWGYVVIFAFYAGEHVLYPFMSEVLNNRAQEEQRATVLSVASFLRTLPYVALAPIIGYLNTHDELEYFLVAWAVVIGIAVVMYLMLKRNDTRISLAHKDTAPDERIPEVAPPQT